MNTFTVPSLPPLTIPEMYRATYGGITEFSPPPFLQTCRLVVGAAFVGKTTTFLQQPHTAYFDTQRGARFSGIGAGSMVFPVNNWGEMLQRLDPILTAARKGKPVFHAVVFDTIARLRAWFEAWKNAEFAAETEGMKPGPAKARRQNADGSMKVLKQIMGIQYENWVTMEILNVLGALRDAGMGWTCIAHLKINETKADERDPYSPWVIDEGIALGMGFYEKLAQEADFFLHFDEVQYPIGAGVPAVDGAPKPKWAADAPAYEAERVKVLTRCTERKAHVTNRDRGVRIPLSPEIWLPRSRAYATLEEDYLAACAREHRFWSKLNQPAEKNPGVPAATPTTGVTAQGATSE